jgi:hypothetical protein
VTLGPFLGADRNRQGVPDHDHDASEISGDAELMTVRAGRITGGTINGKTIILAGASGVIRSDDFVTGTSGWQIAGDGSAEFNDVLVRGDIESGNWDGTSPANLATVDAGATVGFYLDSSVGSAQFEGDIFLGGDLTLDGSGTVRTAPSGQRVEMIGSSVDRITFYETDGTTAATLAGAATGGFSLTGTAASAVTTSAGTLNVEPAGALELVSSSDNVTIHADQNDDTADSAVIVAVDNAEVARFTGDGISTAARGQLDYAQVTANQNGISTATDLTGLSVTVTVGSGRRVKITGHGVLTQRTGAGLAVLIVREVSGATLGQLGSHTLQTNENHLVDGSVVITPSAGAHTYNLSLSTSANTVDWGASSTAPAFILVEDIGPA